MQDFHIQLDLSFYDTMMMAQMIAHARRYGDNQLSDWASDLRARMDQLAGGKPSAIKPEADPAITGEAVTIIEKSIDEEAEEAEKSDKTKVKSAKPKARFEDE